MTCDVGDLADAEKEIDLRQCLLQPLPVTLGETSGHDQMGAGPFSSLFPGRHAEDLFDRFLLGREDEGAGVDQDDGGLLRPVREEITACRRGCRP